MTNFSDNGPNPYVIDIESLTLENENYRTTIWTGNNLQSTLMAIQPGHDIGLEVHHTIDQFLRVEQGEATVYMGDSEDNLNNWSASDGTAVFVPAGKWHNLVNTGSDVLKLYSIYAPVQHAHGTVHVTKEEADIAEAEEQAQSH